MTTIVHTDVGPWVLAARAEGPMAALSLLAAGVLPGLVPFGRGGFAVVPAQVLADGAHVWLDGVRVDRGREQAVGEARVDDGLLLILRHPRVVGADVNRDNWYEWHVGVLRVRLELSEGLLHNCVDYLGWRDCGDSTILRQQLVKSALAEVLTEHLEVRAVLTGGLLAAPALAHLHRQISEADHQLLRLLGASGFTAAGVGQTVYVSELLADAYTPAEVP
ncbi:MAG: hypothetical protein JWQ81_7416 [Amycolatopsis sp.]|uniref:DUF2786 domain-containing protein n=1 Tax=Amycolatopsis sp. TaxID=37632 RepID=UPI00263267D4|nr:DUF2786 domain-containing protein [Amycolatopsis sp.]MCU1686677.1 hypothetical protein [Amycolatopsis sp.]